jgi:hypothetical protein
MKDLIPIGAYFGVDKIHEIGKLYQNRLHLKEKVEEISLWKSEGVLTEEEGNL